MAEILARYWQALLAGTNITFTISGIAWIVGLACGALLALLSELGGRGMQRVLGGASLLVSSIPVLVLLLWAHYPLQSLLGIAVAPLLTTTAVLCVVNALGTWKLLDTSRQRVPAELVEACRLCGMSRTAALRHVLGPATLRLALGGLVMLQISILHMSIFGSIISVPELLRVVQQINALEYRPIALYSILALFFLAISLPVFLLARRLHAER